MRGGTSTSEAPINDDPTPDNNTREGPGNDNVWDVEVPVPDYDATNIWATGLAILRGVCNCLLRQETKSALKGEGRGLE